MAEPRGYEKKQSRLARQLVVASDLTATAELNADNVGPEIVKLSVVAEKVTWQSSGDLAGTIEFSCDGLTWYGSAALATAPTTYSTHLAAIVRVTRSSGTGKVTIAVK